MDSLFGFGPGLFMLFPLICLLMMAGMFFAMRHGSGKRPFQGL